MNDEVDLGIDITGDKRIIFTDAHERLVVTDPEKNPQVTRKGSLEIKSVFGRNRRGDRRDGNPFIYALKGVKGYSVASYELFKLRTTFNTILEKITEDIHWNYVLTVPSSYKVAEFLAKRISRKKKSIFVSDFFVKKSVRDVVTEIELSAIPEKLRPKVKKEIKRLSRAPADESLVLKNIDNKLRPFFLPVSKNPDYRGPVLDGPVLLVDDLLSTGTTLTAARKCLIQNSINCTHAVCLLSDLR